MLADTLDPQELLTLDAQQLLHRLFWQEGLEPLDTRAWRFRCTCSRDKVRGMLRTLGRSEVDSIVHERGSVEVHCDYCNAAYRFDAVDAALLFAEEASAPPGSGTLN